MPPLLLLLSNGYSEQNGTQSSAYLRHAVPKSTQCRYRRAADTSGLHPCAKCNDNRSKVVKFTQVLHIHWSLRISQFKLYAPYW